MTMLRTFRVFVAACALGGVWGRPASAVEADASVESGRNALGSRWRFPWYDGDTDGVRRINVKTPWREPQFSGPRVRPNISLLEIVAWTALAVVLGVLCYLLVKAFLNREARTATEAGTRSVGRGVDDAARVEALPFRIERGATNLLAEAQRLYEAGNYREAVIYLFSFQLVEMDRHQIIRLAKGKTNRQYLREVRRRPTLEGLVAQTMVAFEDVFFGDHPLDRPRFESCWRRLDEFNALVAQQVSA